jgi:hypothetical protein
VLGQNEFAHITVTLCTPKTKYLETRVINNSNTILACYFSNEFNPGLEMFKNSSIHQVRVFFGQGIVFFNLDRTNPELREGYSFAVKSKSRGNQTNDLFRAENQLETGESLITPGEY